MRDGEDTKFETILKELKGRLFHTRTVAADTGDKASDIPKGDWLQRGDLPRGREAWSGVRVFLHLSLAPINAKGEGGPLRGVGRQACAVAFSSHRGTRQERLPETFGEGGPFCPKGKWASGLSFHGTSAGGTVPGSSGLLDAAFDPRARCCKASGESPAELGFEDGVRASKRVGAAYKQGSPQLGG